MKVHDESGKKWDEKDETGLRYSKEVVNVEYQRDIKPILKRSCAACHNHKTAQPAGNLALDDEDSIEGVPGAYYRLALDHGDHSGRFGYKSLINGGVWRGTNASRYIRKFQSRRSLLIWKIYGERLDGWKNDDFPTETTPGDPQTLQLHGQHVPATQQNLNRADLDFTGSIMPPPAAVAGTYCGADGRAIQVAPLTDEDRLTLVRWIDLGCPLDLDYDSNHPERRGRGWLADETRPTLTLTYPKPGTNERLTDIVIGMHDFDSGLDMATLDVAPTFRFKAGVSVRTWPHCFSKDARASGDLRSTFLSSTWLKERSACKSEIAPATSLGSNEHSPLRPRDRRQRNSPCKLKSPHLRRTALAELLCAAESSHMSRLGASQVAAS